MKDKLNAVESANMSISSIAGLGESAQAEGVYTFKCFDKAGGSLLWEQVIDNVVCTLGKNLMLQTTLTGSGYTVVGPYMGLISIYFARAYFLNNLYRCLKSLFSE